MRKATTPVGRAHRLSLIAAGVAAILVFGGAQTAIADLTPDSGPTAGGTVVSDQYPVGVKFTLVGGGGSSSTALGDDGLVYSWGDNSVGQIGDGTDIRRPTPTPVLMPAGVSFTDVSVGDAHVLALGSDGRVYSWGENNLGQLGDGTDTNRFAPAAIPNPPGVTEFIQVMAGRYHSLALASDGTAYAWGAGNGGKLGNGATDNVDVPTLVTMPTGVTFATLAAGEVASAAIAADGSVYAWGGNFSGTIGDGTNTDRRVPTPVQMPVGVGAATLSVGSEHMAALGKDGKGYAWGLGRYGQLGNGAVDDSNIPELVSVPTGIVFRSVVAAGNSTYALTADGIAYAWGLNVDGQLGDGTTTNRRVPTPVHMPVGVTFTVIGGGIGHTVAQGSDANTYAWGSNGFDQLGDGTTRRQVFPVPVTRDVIILSVTFGGVAGTSVAQANGTGSATTPPGCGPVDVVVRWSLYNTTGERTYPNGFFYGTMPTVTTQPASTKVAPGSSTTLRSAATGDSTPTVQWQSSPTPNGPWADIAGADAASYSAAPSEETSFRAVYTNCNGATSSRVATIALQAPASGPGVHTGGSTSGGSASEPAITGGSVPWTSIAIGLLLTIAGGFGLLLRHSMRARIES